MWQETRAKYTDAEVDAIVAVHRAIADAHHSKYTDAEAVNAVETVGKVGINNTSPASMLDVVGLGVTKDTPVIPDNEDTISIYGDGRAYVKARDVTNDIEFLMGTSSAGGCFCGSMTSHALWFRTDNATRMTILQTSGKVGINTTAPTAYLDVNSTIIRLRTAKTPASAGAAGNQGDWCWDADYFYICVATNTWERAPHAWDSFKFDTIVENTGDNGVNVETVNIKDGHINELQKLIFKDPTELTISGGAITVTQSRHSIDTQSDDATDDLVTINGGEDGQILILNTENSARDVTLKHGTGNILISGGDYTMDSAYNIVMLIYTGTYWMKLM